MKRSSKLALVAVAGVTAVAAYSWYDSSAEAETDGSVYTSINDCVSLGNDEATCKARFGEAIEAYQKTAPRFVAKEDCERDFGSGACTPVEVTSNSGQTTTTTQSYFMPLMIGFMAGRMMQGAAQQRNAYAASPLYGCAGGMAGAGGSCYSSNSGRSYYTSGGSRSVRVPVSEFRNTVSRPGASVIPRGGTARSAVSSRGGFGSTGRGFSGGSYGG